MLALTQKLFVIDAENLQNAASVYRTVNHWLRLKLIEMIQKAGATDTTLILPTLRPEQLVSSAHSKI